MGTYSDAPQAAKKRAIDNKIGGAPDIGNEGYLKALIKEASSSSVTVSSSAKGLQFFIVRGGGEGFLTAWYSGKDASNIIQLGSTTSKAGVSMKLVDNDLLAVFAETGKLINAALLRRPRFVEHRMGEAIADDTYAAWDGRPVSLYRNENFDVKYYGLSVDDSRGNYRGNKIRIDMHKYEKTNGCILIVDGNTPSLDHIPVLNSFEPQIILDIQKVIGERTKQNIGTMHMIEIK
jgi:hypothetical protein